MDEWFPAGAAERGRAARFGLLGMLAAVAATAGDFLLLWVVNAARPELSASASPPDGALIAGHYLGTLAIPFYAAGYGAVAAGLAPAGRFPARWVLYLGALSAAVGAAVHAVTAVVIHAGQSGQAALAADPITVVLRSGAFLVPLWGILGLTALAGSALYARAVWTGGSLFPRWMAFLNPVALIAGVSLFAAPFPLGRDFLVPAAPNISHIFFFGIAALLLKRQAHSRIPP